MATNIFRVMCSIQRSMLTDKQSFSEDRIRLMKSFSEFIKSGVFTDSESEKFICANYRLSNKELATEWNMLHVTSKSEHTFRGQVSTLSTKILSLFGCSIEEFELAFMSEGAEPLLVSISDIINAFDFDSIETDFRYDFTLQKYLHGYDSENDYSLDECQQELAILRLFDARNLQNMFESVDKDKLAYLYRMMTADLVLYEDYVVPRKNKSTGGTLTDAFGNPKTRKYILPVINDLKVSLYKVLKQTKPAKLSLVKSVVSKPSVEVSSVVVEDDIVIEDDMVVEEDLTTKNNSIIEDELVAEDFVVTKEVSSSELSIGSVSLVDKNIWGINASKNIVDYIVSMGHRYSEFGYSNSTEDEEDAISEWLNSLTPSTLMVDVEDYISKCNLFALDWVLDQRADSK